MQLFGYLPCQFRRVRENALWILARKFKLFLTIKWFGLPPPPGVFLKFYILERGWSPWFFVNFNISISHIFSENFIEIADVVHKIWRFPPLGLTIFINFSILWHSVITKKLMTSACSKWCQHFFAFNLLLILDELFFSGDIKGGNKLTSSHPPQEKTSLQKPSLIRVKSVQSPPRNCWTASDFAAIANLAGFFFKKK